MDLSMKQNAYYEQSLEAEVYPHLKAALGLIDPLLGVTLLGRKKHWHTYSVVARKII